MIKALVDYLDTSAHGIFESLRGYRGRFFLAEEHLNRLFESAQSLGWRLPFSRQEILRRMEEELQQQKNEPAFARVTVYRDWEQERYSLSVVVIPSKEYPREYYERGVTVSSVPTRRNRVNALSPQVKSNNVLPGVFAIEEAHLKGAFEAVQMNSLGFVAEGTVSNLFIVQRGTLLTPPSSVGILKGVTRDLVIRLAKDLGIEVKKIPFTRHELYNSQECFLTNTSMGIMPVREVDQRVIGTSGVGPVTKRLTESLNRVLKEWEAGIDQNSNSADKCF